jgi:hypothetical protein
MKANVGNLDRAFRIVVGLVIVGIGVSYKSWWGAIGLLPLVTAFVRFCPAYTILGISTCSTGTCGCSCSKDQEPKAKVG